MPDSFEQLPFDTDDRPPSSPHQETVPGLHYLPGWLAPDDCARLLAAIDAAPWSTQLRRRVQHYGHRYDYGSRSVASDARSTPAPPIPAWAAQHAVRLVGEGFMQAEADQVIVNEYQPGQGISAHVDCVPCFGPVVAAISLNSACVMDFTHPGEGTRVEVPLAPGSLCVMTGPARYTWRHSIAARKSDPGAAGRTPRGRRVSVTFRTIADPAP
ncbi:alpha-ketoglutarate-dependent dioxygenase AlkB [Nonomuraea sp. B12E4]|uniref:alpha-ketoglutarate-dependent dioxygenase AlkB n=1 Tax=Nonomuraea sp. B12E4 TaxID=3153564 RepID=UPI00325DAA6B